MAAIKCGTDHVLMVHRDGSGVGLGFDTEAAPCGRKV
jgi:hypothetical protein